MSSDGFCQYLVDRHGTRIVRCAGDVLRHDSVKPALDQGVGSGCRSYLSRDQLPSLPGGQRMEHANHDVARRREQRHLARVNVLRDDVPAPGLRTVG